MTPAWDEYVELVAATTLLFGSKAVRMPERAGWLSAGDSVGQDLRKGGLPGREGKDRSRDWLPVRTQIVIDGRYDQDNVLQARNLWRTNLLTLKFTVVEWLDANRSGFTVKLTTPAGTFEGAGKFETFGTWNERAHRSDTSALFTVPAGLMAEVGS